MTEETTERLTAVNNGKHPTIRNTKAEPDHDSKPYVTFIFHGNLILLMKWRTGANIAPSASTTFVDIAEDNGSKSSPTESSIPSDKWQIGVLNYDEEDEVDAENTEVAIGLIVSRIEELVLYELGHWAGCNEEQVDYIAEEVISVDTDEESTLAGFAMSSL